MYVRSEQIAFIQRMGSQLRHADGLPVLPRDQVVRLPSGARPDTAAVLQRQQKAMRGERIVRTPALGGLGTGAGIPLCRVDTMQRGKDIDGHGLFGGGHHIAPCGVARRTIKPRSPQR